MRKFYAIAASLFLTITSATAQVWTIAVCSSGPPSSTTSSVYGPMNSVATANAGNRTAVIYPASQLTGIAAQTLTAAYFHRATTTGTMAGTPNFKIYLKEVGATDWGTSAVTWATEIATATLVYNGNPAPIAGNAAGWKAFPFSTNFNYSGTQNLAVFMEYSNATASTAIQWSYEFTSPCANTSNSNTTKYGNVTTATLPATLSSTNYRRPYIGFDMPCTSPPVPGTAVASAAAICSGSTVQLSVTGNSTGGGQTYVWQSSASSGGTYTDISSPSATAGFTASPTALTFYRVAVTCGGNTLYSTPVQVSVNFPLAAGTYTVNSGGTGDYQTLTQVANALSCGITGPVVFNVDPGTGPYNEQIIIPAIPGTSAVNTVTINGNDAIIQATPVTDARPLIRLDGSDYVTIRRFNIVAITGSTFGWGVHLTNGADNNKIDSCTINMSAITSTTQSNSAGIVISASNTSVTAAGSGSNNTFSNNTITGAYQGVIISGTATSLNAVNNSITKNSIHDFYSNGIILTHNDGAVVSYNDIHRSTRSGTSPTTLVGIELGTGNKNCTINANRIHDTHTITSSQTTTAYGVYATGCDAPAGSENKVTNNLLYNFNSGSGTIYALYNSGSDGIHYYHNTVVLDNAAASDGTTRGFYQTTAATGIIFKNNIISISRGGTGAKHCLYFGTTTSTIASNKNVLFMNSFSGTTGVGSFGTTNYTTLADWQAVNSAAYDQLSESTDPLFINPGAGDYTPSAISINNIGDNVGVALDITGAPRTVANPDPGAYEFTLPPCTNPPVPGVAATSKAIACTGESFTLNLVGNSSGEGQTYQWQSSPDNGVTPWVNMGPLRNVPFFTTTQTATSWYRAIVTCGAGTPVNSTSVLVTTPGLVSGVYTINSGSATGGTNFQSFADAINYMKCGINGAVTFNIQPNTAYNEQVIIQSIPGASALNTITFNGNGSALTFNSTSGTERATIKLQGADYIRIDSLQIFATGSLANEYGYGVHIVDDADNNIISRCPITVTSSPVTAASTNFAGIVINASSATTPHGTGNSQCDNNLLSANRVIGGYLGIAIVANGTTNTITGNIALNNTVQDFYTSGIHLNGNTGAVIEGNDISRPTRSSVDVFNGINMDGVSVSTLVSKNRVHNPFDAAPTSALASYGIRIASSDATAATANIISNNFIYGFNGSGGTTSTVAQNGILNNSSDNVKFYYNSILLDDASASCNCPSRGIYIQDAGVTGIDIRNNSIVVGRGGTGAKQALYFEPTSVSGYTINNNNYYLLPIGSGTVSELVHMGAAATPGYTTLAAWQTASGKDANSFNLDPLYVSPADLHLQGSSSLDDK
jgi:hypothetical protein